MVVSVHWVHLLLALQLPGEVEEGKEIEEEVHLPYLAVCSAAGYFRVVCLGT